MTTTTESAADRAPLVLALVDCNVYGDIADWARDSDYTYCDGSGDPAAECDTHCGWVDHNDNPVDIDQAYLDAKESELAALEAEFAAAGGRGPELADRIDLLRVALTGTRAQILVHAYPPQEGISVGDGFYDEGDGADGFHEVATAAGFVSDASTAGGEAGIWFTMRHAGDGSLVTYQEGDLFLTQHVDGVDEPEVTDLHLPDGSCCLEDDDEPTATFDVTLRITSTLGDPATWDWAALLDQTPDTVSVEASSAVPAADDRPLYEVTVRRTEFITYELRADDADDAEARYLPDGDETASKSDQPTVVEVRVVES